MRKRNIQKIVRFNRKEAQDLAAKAKKACLSEAGLIRLLIRGYEPKEKPDDRFYDVMRELSSIGNNINQLAAKANTLGFIDAPMLKNEAAKWNKFQSEIERTYLRPNPVSYTHLLSASRFLYGSSVPTERCPFPCDK